MVILSIVSTSWRTRTWQKPKETGTAGCLERDKPHLSDRKFQGSLLITEVGPALQNTFNALAIKGLEHPGHAALRARLARNQKGACYGNMRGRS